MHLNVKLRLLKKLMAGTRLNMKITLGTYMEIIWSLLRSNLMAFQVFLIIGIIVVLMGTESD